MNDINEIYAPIYREPNRILFYILMIVIILIVVTAVLYIIKRIKSRPGKEKTLDEIYSDSIDEITSLGTELHERHLYIFKDFLSNIYRDNFYAKTNEELLNNVKLKDLDLHELLSIYNQKFYSGQKIDKTVESKIISELVECITKIYNKESIK